VSSAMVQAVKLVLQKANTALMEPMMKLVIHAEPDVVNALVQDLVMRRGEILEREELLINKSMIIMTAQAPLSELRGYSTHLRSITSGKAFFGMEFSHYDLMDLSNQNKAILEVTGFQP
jgi:elongation factor G